MPRVKLDYVVSFSSEDSENPASNLLAYDVSKKKWLCNTGEPSCSVVLQLARAVQISTIHIGAYHAALVEVLVGRSETPNDQFEVLVPSSVFLSPMDSRRGSGVERVRSFSAEQLAPARMKRWDRVRVVCSQPYNKHCKYGLSFIHIFEAEDNSHSPAPPVTAVTSSVTPVTSVPARVTANSYSSSDEDEFRPGELFAKHLQRTSDVGTTKNTEAQIRQATSQALKNIPDSSTKLVKTPITKASTSRAGPSGDCNANRRRDTLMYDDDDEKPHTKIDSIVQRHKDEKEQEINKKDAVQNLFKKDRNTSTLESASKNFKEFLEDKDLNSSRTKESSRDDKRSNSTSSSDKKKPDLNNSRSNSFNDNDKRNKDNLNNSRKDSRGDDRRNNEDNNNTQRTKVDKDRDNRKRQHSDDRQKGKDVLRAGPVSSSPHTLLSGVVFALSGYENPRRGRLRDQAVAMGARFERDWNPSCTHLICAFPNTPKLRTVRNSQSDCIAVLGDWIEQCCDKRRLLPWQWFATEPKRKVAPPAGWDADVDDKTASECDTDDEIEKVLRKQKKQRTDQSPSHAKDTPQPRSSRDKSPKPHSSRDRSPKPPSSRERSPKFHSSKDRSPKPHSSRNRSPKPYSSRERSPKSHFSRDKSPKPHSSRDRSPKPPSSRNRSPKPHSSKDRSPKPHSSRDGSPKPPSSREAKDSRDRSPIPQSSKKQSPRPQTSKEKSPKHNCSNMSTDSDVAFVKDERIKANITIDDSTDEEDTRGVKERVDKSKVLPDFFDGCTFVVDDDVIDAGFDKELLVRYVKAYGGVVMDPSQLEADDEVNYVLSAGAESELKGRRVRADWVWRCHRDKQLCELGEYAL